MKEIDLIFGNSK